MERDNVSCAKFLTQHWSGLCTSHRTTNNEAPPTLNPAPLNPAPCARCLPLLLRPRLRHLYAIAVRWWYRRSGTPCRCCCCCSLRAGKRCEEVERCRAAVSCVGLCCLLSGRGGAQKTTREFISAAAIGIEVRACFSL